MEMYRNLFNITFRSYLVTPSCQKINMTFLQDHDTLSSRNLKVFFFFFFVLVTKKKRTKCPEPGQMVKVSWNPVTLGKPMH